MTKLEKKRFDRFIKKAVAIVQTPWTYVLMAKLVYGGKQS